MSSDHSKLLSNLLIGILLLVGLVALPTVLQVQRSVLLDLPSKKWTGWLHA